MLTEVKPFAQGYTDRQTDTGKPGPDSGLSDNINGHRDVVALWTGFPTGQTACAFCLSFYIWRTSIGTLFTTTSVNSH